MGLNLESTVSRIEASRAELEWRIGELEREAAELRTRLDDAERANDLYLDALIKRTQQYVNATGKAPPSISLIPR